jgi:hypothetical protein
MRGSMVTAGWPFPTRRGACYNVLAAMVTPSRAVTVSSRIENEPQSAPETTGSSREGI